MATREEIREDVGNKLFNAFGNIKRSRELAGEIVQYLHSHRSEITNQPDIELKKELEKVNWPITYGNVKVQLRNGKPTLVTIERTVKLD